MTPVGCFPQPDGRLAIVASDGGATTNPHWYYNLKAHPKINVEYGSEVFAVEARELEGHERDDLWTGALRSAPQLGEYQRRTKRTIPVLLLVRPT